MGEIGREEAKGATSRTGVADIGDLLRIDIDVDVSPVCDDRDRVALSSALVKGRTGARQECVGGCDEIVAAVRAHA